MKITIEQIKTEMITSIFTIHEMLPQFLNIKTTTKEKQNYSL